MKKLNLPEKTKIEIYNLYTTSMRTMQQIALEYNISIRSVYNIRKEMENNSSTCNVNREKEHIIIRPIDKKIPKMSVKEKNDAEFAEENRKIALERGYCTPEQEKQYKQPEYNTSDYKRIGGNSLNNVINKPQKFEQLINETDKKINKPKQKSSLRSVLDDVNKMLKEED